MATDPQWELDDLREKIDLLHPKQVTFGNDVGEFSIDCGCCGVCWPCPTVRVVFPGEE